MSDTPSLGLPLLEASQAQKHVTHNEALMLLDAMLHLAVISRQLATPPAAPSDGDRYLIADAASGEWQGHSHEIAYRQAGSWRFAEPRAGWRLWVIAESAFLLFDGTTWQDLAVPDILQNMALLGVGTSADPANRLAVSSPNILFNHAGSDARVKINKSATSDTAALLFQTGYSGHAEFGLSGDDNFQVKVSPDGATWKQAINVDKATGLVTLASNSVTNASLADMPAATFKGRRSTGPGDPEDLTAAQLTSLLNIWGRNLSSTLIMP